MSQTLIDSADRQASPWRQAVRAVFYEYKYFWIAFLVVWLDQLVKFVVKFNMSPYDEVSIIGDTFTLNYIENKGAAFGLTVADLAAKIGLNVSEETAKLILTLFSIFAVMAIMYFLRRVRHHKTLLPLCIALILGGAIGNIVDRVFYGVWFAGINDYEGGLLHGRVVDMFYLDLYHGKIFGFDVNLWPVFNIADAAISVGIVMVLIFQRRFFKKLDAPATPPEAPAAEKTEPSELALNAESPAMLPEAELPPNDPLPDTQAGEAPPQA